ncbi:insulinase family protein [Prolixibacteraceae bacterium JC049]|nr:insulinase family protein [Prolixibacteraceae bacterium JC049]
MRKNYFISLLGIFLFMSGLVIAQQPQQIPPVPMEPQTKVGKLPNGMTYYIRHNEEPKERASFYIIQNVGAMLEHDNQNGLAHFLEHMAFNGTEHFKGKGIINMLEKHGVAFGRNLNAYTSFDETVYNISNVPTTESTLLDSCLLILNDWSNYLLLTEEEIDNERGVIREEWRTRRTAGFRLAFNSFKEMYKGSKYAERDIIGDLDVINNFEYKTIRDFYHDWYRTDLQAIAIVGDFDADKMEAKVKEMFSKIPAVENPRKREFFEVPDNKEPIFALVTDPEATTSDVTISIKHPTVANKDKNVMYYRQDMVVSLYNAMMRNRISELLQKGTPPFINGRSGFGGHIARTKDFYNIDVTLAPNKFEEGLTAILVETERVKRHGFTAGELDRAKTNMLTNIESAFKKRDKRSHDHFCSMFKTHYLQNEPAPGIEFRYQFAQQVLPTISVEEINTLAPKWLTKENRVYIVTGPEKDDVKHLTKEQVFGIVDKVDKMEIEAYVDEVAATSLIEEDIKGGKVVSTKELKELDAVEWTLSNGVKVVYRFSDLNKDQVLFTSFSKGGASQYSAAELPSASFGTTLMGTFGVGDFDAIAFKKVMTGKKAGVSASVGTLTEALNGNCVPKDFETMLQLIYLNFEKPRFDESAFNAIMQRYKAYFANMQNNPQKIVQDSITRIMNNYHERAQIMDSKYLEQVDLKTIEKVYRDRFQDASDFTFCFTGNVKAEDAKPLIEKYLGALTDKDRTEKWVDHKMELPKGKTIKDIHLSLNIPKATVVIRMGKDIKYTPENKLYASMLKAILDLRYTESVREEEGGTYGVGVGAWVSHYPTSDFNLFIKFDCDPAKADHLRPIIHRELDKILAEGPTQVDLDKVVKNMKKQRAESMQKNNFWLGALKTYYFDNENIAAAENFDNIVDNVTVKDIQKAAKNFIKGADIVEITFRPKAE